MTWASYPAHQVLPPYMTAGAGGLAAVCPEGERSSLQDGPLLRGHGLDLALGSQNQLK